MVGTNHYSSHLARWIGLFGRDKILVVFYDELLQNPQTYVDQFTRFLGLSDIDLSYSYLKSLRLASIRFAPKYSRLAARACGLRKALEYRRMHRTISYLTLYFRHCFQPGEELALPDRDFANQLRRYFIPEVEAIERLLGRDLSVWKNPNQ
jgi:hypothetical protein